MRKLLLLLAAMAFTLMLSAQTNLLKTMPGKLRKQFSQMVFIPADTLFEYNRSFLGRPFAMPGQKPKVTAVVSSFYLSAYEVSNKEWREFCALNKTDLSLLPDTNCWREKLAYQEPMVEVYFRHPATANYPVVGINYTQAEAFAKWKTQQADSILKAHNFKEFRLVFRLPTATELEFTLQHHYNYALINGKGDFVCNFGAIRDTFGYNVKIDLGSGPNDSDNSDMTAPVNAYKPSKLGLYNIRGNVAEWTSTPDPKQPANLLAKGGSWKDAPYYLLPIAAQSYAKDAVNSGLGLRLAMDIIEVNK